MSNLPESRRLSGMDALAAAPEDMTRDVGYYMCGGAAVIEAPANFDRKAALAVRDLAIQLQRDGAAGVVINLAAARFIDNAALGVIAWALKRFREAGGWLAVARASRPVTHVFTGTNLATIVPMHPTVVEAVSAARAAAP